MSQFFSSIGVTMIGVSRALVFPLLTTMLLFCGPMALKVTGDVSEKRFTEPLIKNPFVWRDLIIAPLTEEFIFRSLTLAVLAKVVSICNLDSTLCHADITSANSTCLKFSVSSTSFFGSSTVKPLAIALKFSASPEV